ncbi:P-loop containing nucleoside triphosphate hydrolase protein [Cunninghamella echinulata]|nr:P-loop containing nucleoside triphosphate hydrolase protein [Cunninghamella echinulata]
MSKNQHRRYYTNTKEGEEEDEERYLPTGESYRVPSLKTPSIKSKWDFKSIINDSTKHTEAVQNAQKYIKQQQSLLGEPVADIWNIHNEHGDLVWLQEIDDIFFSKRKRGLVSWWIWTGSPIYYEFENFFKKLIQQISSSNQQTFNQGTEKKIKYELLLQEQGTMIRHTLVLFYDFQSKKQTSLKKKLDQHKESLPITQFANAIIHTLKQHRILLIAAETGCGKSTQVPQILMQAGFKKIACTQPRRIACSSLAKRVSYETMNEYGSEIAYQVRFEATKTNRTRILFLTEGLLLRQYAMDNTLSMYDVIVVDEVHERHMMGDFLIAILKKLKSIRNDLYIVLMSATINTELFASYFDAPTLMVPGKMYDVKVHYWQNRRHGDDSHLVNEQEFKKRQASIIKQSIPSKSDRLDPAPYLNIMSHIDSNFSTNERGDLLIFMSGINEIMALEEQLRIYSEKTKKWIILILHSSVAIDDQEKIFDAPPAGIRKCIISSNIAETSVTIDGIRFIIDSGKVKELNHDSTNNMRKLSEFWISKASAEQRKGRAGRTGPGECFRLYSENEYLHLNDYSVPEIQRGALEPVILNIKALNLGDPRNFDFLERPSMDSIESSIYFLQNLGALDNQEQITSLGKALANLPVDAVIGKMILLGVIFNVVDPILTIIACMSVQSPFVRVTSSSTSDIAKNQRSFDSHHGDPFTLLNLWKTWLDIKSDRKQSSRQWCKRYGIEEQRLYEIAKLRGQFEKIVNYYKFTTRINEKDENDNAMDNQTRYQKRDLLRRQKYDQHVNKKRRMLSMDQEYNGENDDDDRIDIRDIEFSMKNNLKRLQQKAIESTSNEKNIQLLKLIICSALYPQIAIGDEHNPYRKSDELIFHTSVAGFLLLHPTSTLAHHPDWVREPGENIRKDDIQVEQAIQNQLLCYLQLLETTKPYLLNLTRVPGIHILLLFSKQLDTNEDCSVIVVDSYYVIKFKTKQVAQYILAEVFKLRYEWDKLFNQRLGSDLNIDNKNSNTVDNNESILSLTTSSVKSYLPLILQDILELYEQKSDSPMMWTPSVEANFQFNVRSLSDNLVQFLSSSISATLEIGRPSLFLKMCALNLKKESLDHGILEM